MKKIILSLLFLCSFVFAQAGIHVEAYDEQQTNARQATIRLRVVNSTEQTFNNVRLTYYLYKEANRGIEIHPYYTPSATVHHETNGDQVEINIDIPTLAPGVFPNSSGMNIGINYTDWQAFDKTASVSYPNSSSFVVDNNIAIFIDGQPYQVVGPVLTDPAQPRFVGVQPEISSYRAAWVEISNFDNDNKNSLNGFYIKDASGSTLSLDGKELPKGQKLIICNTDSKYCPTADIQIISTELAFGLDGELTLYNANNEPVDYVAWGTVGPNAAAVASANSALNTNEYLKTHYDEFELGSNYYGTGDFYRAIVSETQNTVKEWKLFSAKEIEKNAESTPDPKPLSLSDGSIVTLFEGEEMVFSWIAVKGAKKYILTVINDVTNEVAAQVTTAYTSVSVFLQPGTYRWTVEASQTGDFETSLESLIAHKDDLTELTIRTRVFSDDHIVYNLHVDPLAARRDSYLLDLQWGEMFNEKRGGMPHNLSAYYDNYHQLQFSDPNEKGYDYEESWRCWIVSAVMLNHYYGGTITQDEIKVRVKGNPNDMYLDAFPHGSRGGGYVSDVNEALQIALNVPQEKLHYLPGRPDETYLIDALSQGRPIYIWQYSHIMTIDAVRLDPELGVYEFRFINVDNNGRYEWRVFEKESSIRFTWIPSDVTNAQNSDPAIENDSDGDGLYDYDEINRFHTKVDKEDSDGDEVNDREEILSYTLRNKKEYESTFLTSDPLANVDGDEFRAELDYDSDNGGAKDGDEDLNHDGIFDEGETDPYKASDDPGISTPEPSDLPEIYAISTLIFRQQTNCTKDNGGYCDLAAAGIQSNYYNNMIIGDENHVGALHTLGTIYFQHGIQVHGDINLYGSDAKVAENSSMFWYLVGGEVVNRTVAEFNETFPTVIDVFGFQEERQPIYVGNGQTLTLEAGVKYGTIIVGYNGTLIIPAGEFYVKNLQLQDYGKVKFSQPGQQTILHIDGEFFWRAPMDHSEQELKTIASSFEVLISTQNRDYFINKTFAGRIVAPYSNVYIETNQGATFYGSITAFNIEARNFANIKVIPYASNN
ncbi:MAG: hypothetical protein IK012_02455 [Fibrobacter sp.]|uniref:hypothetical protein n=1 Tax=Fibrobacter sp. TaxID=35828 RepID=UPI0025C43E3C|nr:hypothetical protein [Fibrobacter sp.]MBR4784098.1 hypothetical protein [Fibrobacter sp.]